MTKEMTIDKRIKEILKWGSMAAALYFSVAIDVLKQVIAQKNDREGTKCSATSSLWRPCVTAWTRLIAPCIR